MQTEKSHSLLPSMIDTAFNGMGLFVFGIIGGWAIGYFLGVFLSKSKARGRNRGKPILPELLGFIGLSLGALMLKGLVF